MSAHPDDAIDTSPRAPECPHGHHHRWDPSKDRADRAIFNMFRGEHKKNKKDPVVLMTHLHDVVRQVFRMSDQKGLLAEQLDDSRDELRTLRKKMKVRDEHVRQCELSTLDFHNKERLALTEQITYLEAEKESALALGSFELVTPVKKKVTPNPRQEETVDSTWMEYLGRRINSARKVIQYEGEFWELNGQGSYSPVESYYSPVDMTDSERI